MNTTIGKLGNRLQALMGDVNFRFDRDKTVDSPEHLLAIGDHNLREYEKIEAMPKERQERIEELAWNILASGLRAEAMKKYGNADSSSIRQVLNDWHYQPENMAYCDRLKRLAKQYLTGCGFTEEQFKIISDYCDEIPLLMLEGIVEETSHLCFLPPAEAQSIAMVLADMVKEEMKC